MSPVDIPFATTSCGTVLCMAGDITYPWFPDKLLEKARKEKQCDAMVSSPPRPERTLYYCHRDFKIQTENLGSIRWCGWYHPDTTAEMAKDMLQKSAVGTFLLRDSLNSKYLYSISVKSQRGATSIRITYHRGKFQLDCIEKLKDKLPKFDFILALVDYYVRCSIEDRSRKNPNRFLDSSGRKDMSIVLTKPRINTVSSLQHLSRQTINRALPYSNDLSYQQHRANVDQLDMLPSNVIKYIKLYPYLN